MNPREAAIYYLEQKAFGRAEKLLREWVLAHPDDTYTHMELIWCFYKRSTNHNRWEDCDQFFEEVYNRPNAQVIRRFMRAEQLYYEDREEESLVHYKAAIDGGLDVPAVHHSLAMALKALGRDAEAKAEYEIAIEQDPRFLPTLDVYGHILFEEGRFDRVEHILQPLDGLEPRSFEYQFKDALKDLESLDRLGKACVALRHTVELKYKEKICDATLTLWPVFLEHSNNCWFVRTMVYLFYRAHWLYSGKKRLEEVLREESPMSSYASGLTLWYEDKYEDALLAYDTALDKGRDHFLVHCARALVYEELEKNQEREADLLAALFQAPWCIYAKEDIARLRYEQGKLNEVDDLVCITPEEYECAVKYDVSGKDSLARLEDLALSSLLKQDKAKKALIRVKQDKIPCEDEDLRFRRAMVYAENRKFSEAALELTESVKLDYRVIGTSYKADKERIQLIIKSDPNCFVAAFASALLPAYADDHRKAKENLETLVKSFPEEAEVWYHLANVSSILGNRLRTKEACREALTVNNNCKDALLLLCKLLQDDGDIQALRSLSKELAGTVEPLEFALKWAEENKQTQVAKDISSELLEIDPTNVGATLCLLERLTFESLEYARMAERLTTSVPLDFGTRFLIARALLLNGEPEEALESYDKLFADGFNSVYHVLMHGLAYLAAQPDKGTARTLSTADEDL